MRKYRNQKKIALLLLKTRIIDLNLLHPLKRLCSSFFSKNKRKHQNITLFNRELENRNPNYPDSIQSNTIVKILKCAREMKVFIFTSEEI